MSSGSPDLSLWSLRGRLIKLFAAGGFAAWTFTGTLILLIAKRENTEDRDNALHRSGVIVLGLAKHEYLEGHRNLDAIEGATMFDLPDLVIQVRDGRGQLLLNSATAPETALSPAQKPFEDARLGDTEWRVANLRDETSGLTVQIAENQAVRRRDFTQLAIALLVPLILGLPVVMVVASLLASRALKPLRSAARKLFDRNHSDLSPIVPGELPQEALPLVDAFNTLLSKLAESWDEERRFAASVAHELRTPLAGIRLNLQRLQKSTKEPETAELLSVLVVAIDRASRVIEQLLTLAGLERNLARETQSEPMDIRRTIDETLIEFGTRIGTRGIHFVIDAEPLVLPIPAQAFYLVLRNFTENAIRHSPDGGAIRISAGVSKHQWWLKVEDDGSGIATASSTTPYGSTENFQIGLSLVRKIEKLLDGTLESGRGSVLGGAYFRFSAPLKN